MHTLILPYSESDTDILAFIDRLRRRKKSFKIEKNLPETPKTMEDTIVWEVPEPDLDWQSIGLKTLANDPDWNSPFDDHWDELFTRTKPITK